MNEDLNKVTLSCAKWKDGCCCTTSMVDTRTYVVLMLKVPVHTVNVVKLNLNLVCAYLRVG